MMTDGRVVHPDLVFGRQRVILEYEGDGHRTDAVQWMRDIRRHDAMVAAGWRVIRVTRHDLFVARPEFLARLARTFRAKGVPAGRATTH
jgi:very-short-patch-repair endonuclease